MTPTSDVARRTTQHLWLVALAGLMAVGGAATWAWWPLPYVVAAPRLPPPAASATVAATIEPATWGVHLWQPFTDAPVVSETPPPPLKLYSILKRNGTFIAALGAGDDAPLVYASSGDVVQGVTIRAVDAKGVDVRSGAGDQRLELRP